MMVKRHRPQQARDADIVFLMQIGYRRKAIAKYYGLSDATVKNILAKERRDESKHRNSRAS